MLIIGASKGIGLETTRQALEAGHRVRAFARLAADIRISGIVLPAGARGISFGSRAAFVGSGKYRGWTVPTILGINDEDDSRGGQGC